jgi:hypothetical protein
MAQSKTRVFTNNWDKIPKYWFKSESLLCTTATSSEMKPTPLPPSPRLLDHVEHALQWLFCWLIVDIPGHPMISGLCTGTILGGLQVVAMYFVVHLATQHLHP